MGIPISLAIIAFAALIHASFQLSVSMLTMLSGQTIGANHTQRKLLGLTTNFVFGAGLITLLLLSGLTFMLMSIFGTNTPQIIWAGACGLLFGVAISVWMFYYRRGKGTALWIPRGVAKYLHDRTKATSMNAEAFGLGVSSVIGEILFIIAPLAIGALAIITLPDIWRLVGLGIYTVISLSSLVIVWMLIGGGHTLGRIQKWREDNKNFLQFAAGAGLIALSLFVYVNEILGTAVGGM
ncbi:MAG: hypothetical protein WCP11_00040 [Candidatus Saccharibacteria bacterium]